MRFKWKGSGIEKSVVLCAKILISFFARSQFPALLRTSRFCEKGRVLRFAIPRCFEPTDQLASRHHLTKAKVLGITQIFKVGIKQGFVVIQQNVSGLERKSHLFTAFSPVLPGRVNEIKKFSSGGSRYPKQSSQNSSQQEVSDVDPI